MNQHNYQERLDYLTALASEFGETDLQFLAEFNQMVKQKYQIQIQQDHATLSPAVRVLEDLIDTIRGLVEIKQAEVEIEQAECDHAFPTFIEVAGMGIGTASVVADASASFAEKIRQESPPIQVVITPLRLSNAWSNVVVVLGLSIIAGALASGLTAWVRSRLR